MIARALLLPLGLALSPGRGSASTEHPAPAPEVRSVDAAELARLAGHRIERLPGDRYRIADVAGEGPPRVGRVERRGRALWLVEADGVAHRLVGPLAIPRIAGPGYAVWITGTLGPGGALAIHRIGVLAPPPR